METRARFVLVGLFSLAVILAGFGFVYWLRNTGGLGERSVYRIRFDNSVSGLLLGSAVQFNGIRVGEVTELGLNPDDPRQVLATIAVREDTPVRIDTKVGLAFGGLTGVPEISLEGGTPEAGTPKAIDGGPPLLLAEAGGSVEWTSAARSAFASVEALLSNNSESLTDTISNLDAFSKALARNSDSLDDIIAGLARLAGVRAGGRIEVFYTLSPAADVSPPGRIPQGQLVVAVPVVPVAFDTQRLMMRTGQRDRNVFEGVGWSDMMPKLAQGAIIQSFANAGYSRAGRDFQGLAADHTLLLEIDSFHIVEGQPSSAKVSLYASIVDTSGSIVAAQRFETDGPIKAMEADAAAHALDSAFQQVEARLVVWALNAIGES
jgi:phospholipid/cholesterol/gamma-HCH transport system substrate-binding protein